MSEIFLVQISDLHFDRNIENARVSKTFEGYDAHDVTYCHALVSALRDAGSPVDMAKAQLLVGGDLTAIGVHEEFKTAQTFLLGAHVLPKYGTNQLVGLGHAHQRYWTVPGNHDHWEGHWPYFTQRGYSRALFPRYFRPSPWITTVSDEGLQLVMAGIDSNSHFEGFGPVKNISYRAGGGFSPRERDEFEHALRKAMTDPLPAGMTKRGGVILCHHPFSTDCAAAPLRQTCLLWLMKLAAELGIPAILTGHTHRFATEPVPVPIRGEIKRVWEIRAPTTLQIDRPAALLETIRRRPGFFLHHLSLDANGAFTWKIKLYLYAARRFQCAANTDWLSL